MERKGLILLSVLLWFLAGGVAIAATSPAKVVQQFIEANLQGRFAEARSFTLERANLSASLFSGWLFAGGAGDSGTADVFLSRKFVQVFSYKFIGTTPSGENQVYVSVLRSSPNLAHMYTWALAPKRGASPYELIEAIDMYLTKVNFPVEESRMQFTLIREVDEWYISVVRDEKFVQLQQQFLGGDRPWLNQQPPIAAAPPPAGAAAPLPGAATAPPPPATTTSQDVGRQMADAQFNATLQGFNRTYQPPAATGTAPQEPPQEKQPSGFSKFVSSIFGGKSETMAKISDAELQKTFNNIRDALARYTSTHYNSFPDDEQIYDWQSLHRLVNTYGKRPIPATEAEAGVTFVNYNRDVIDVGNYTLLLELHKPQDGVKRVQVTPYGIERS
jgi:hypothetical protein